jgi:hypothetical protein
MLLFAGSYERFLFGFSASADCSQPQELDKRYTFAAHKVDGLGGLPAGRTAPCQHSELAAAVRCARLPRR